MSSLSFKFLQSNLYSAPAQPMTVYWLLLFGSPAPGDLGVADTWKYSGCYIFTPSAIPISNLDAFVAALKQALPQPLPTDTTIRYVTWIPDPTNLAGLLTARCVMETHTDPPVAQVVMPQPAKNFSLPLANVSLMIPNMTTLGLDSEAGTLNFKSLNTSGNILLTRQGQGQNLTPSGGQVVVPLSGTSAGALTFAAGWASSDFCTVFMDDMSSFDPPPAGEIRYFYGADGSVQSLRYPVYPPASQQQMLFFNVSLDPLNVWDSGRTSFGLDVSKFGAPNATLPTAQNFFSTDGHPLTLTPRQGAGYGFGKRPPAGLEDPKGTYSYLAPVGLFDVSSATASHAADTGAIRHIMCGLTGTEYLLSAPGATLEFVTGCDAHAGKHFNAPTTSGTKPADPCQPGTGGDPVNPGELLSNEFTTSWVRINPATPAPGLIDYGYAVQPEASVYYSSVQNPATNDAYTYPLALGCRVSQLNAEAGGELVPLPVAPYGGVWSTGADKIPARATLLAFESQIIAAARHEIAPKDMTNGPTFFNPATHVPLDGGKAKTPEGLLVELNTQAHDPGTIGTLLLAKSPNVDPAPPPDAGELSFTGNPVLSPALSNALLNDQLFMVVTQSAPLGGFATTPDGVGFHNNIAVGEWTFNLDAGFTTDQVNDPATILIFKFTTAFNVVDLVADAAYWQQWWTFTDPDPANVKTVQSQINSVLCTAKTNAGDGLFDDFWAKVNDPNWTGILALNCGLDVADLPVDLQDLLGGISGQLRAHHFGITTNRIEGAGSADWDIEQSSLFALIHYDKAYQPPANTDFNFQVLKLNVLIENSALVHFDSRIAFTIPTLFSTEVSLTAPPPASPVPSGYNVIEIDGAYVKHGDSGTVVFDTTTPQIFSFKPVSNTGFRVLSEVYVTDAALVPVSSSTSDGVITVQSNFALSGMLMFVEDVSGADAKGLDLFSYGDTTSSPPKGLAFTSYNFAMTTVITAGVGHLNPITTDLSQFLIVPATSISPPRADSLLCALPLKLTAFVQQPDSTGWPVTFDGQSTDSFAATYALQYQVSLGSLGALSVVADSLDVDLILGWKAATGTADDKMWLLMVPPRTMLGQQGFGIEGVLNTTFSSIEVVADTWTGVTPSTKVYAIRFKDVQVGMLGISLIPVNTDSDFTLFADPKQGNASNLGWLMTLKAVTPGA